MRTAEKRAQAVAAQMASASNTKTTMSYTSAIMTAGRATKIVTTSTTQTFAAKLSEITASTHTSTTVMQSTHNTVNKQKSVQPNIVTVMSATPAATAHASCQQPIISTSPKHCRPLPNLSAASTMTSHYSGKSAYSSGINVMPSATNTAVTNCSENTVAPTSINSVRVTPSPPVVSQTQVLSQQQHVRSSTPVASIIQEHQQSQQQQQSNSTTLEYSLFNDNFTKVAQQSMWGGRENESQKSMNFATVAGGGVSMNTSTTKFIDSAPPQVCYNNKKESSCLKKYMFTNN